ncbi:thermonuclease family protein [Sphingopyxis indica]|uniref:thermonuclease family protein n=1 Tax=Sphingopyxis indica TaxID=436663 RepID=UPI0029394158|nr:thermonuclease family protein [Sphingopyxis indica]MEA3390348.1 thermonuclease family protein [Pseudomonadota bacterium]WOF43353.1 thermonuclease family protein [Sphingopyxis indica]
MNISRYITAGFFAALSFDLPVPSYAAPPIEGRASVVDGDTFDLGRERVRILGIDAPEMDQSCADAAGRSWPCGQRAKAALRTWLGGASVRCIPAYRDQGGRPVARCAARGRDIGGWLVENGWALDYPRYSSGAYHTAEQGAHRRRAGVWAGTVTPPWEWRGSREVARREAPSPPPNPRCALKGNISADGSRIVHAPGQRDYAAVRIDTARGERWFCSLAEARRAGWRPAAR